MSLTHTPSNKVLPSYPCSSLFNAVFLFDTLLCVFSYHLSYHLISLLWPTPCPYPSMRRSHYFDSSRKPGWLCDATTLESCNKPSSSTLHLHLRSETASLWSPAAELTSSVTLSLSLWPLPFSFPFFLSLYTSRDRQSDAHTHVLKTDRLKSQFCD